MADGDYKLVKSNGTTFDEKTVTASAGGMVYFDASLNPVMLAKGTARQRLRINTGETAPEWVNHVEAWVFDLSDESTALTTGTAKLTFRMPYAATLTAVRASVKTAPTGSTIIVDINESGTTILSTKLSIDASEKTSTTAASAAVIDDAYLGDDAEITFDIDQVGSTVAGAGLKVTIYWIPLT